MVNYLPIAGTWGYDGEPDPSEWWHPLSPLAMFLMQRGLRHLDPQWPFIWDGAVDGLHWPWSSKAKNLGWMAAGMQLRYRLRDVPLADRNLIAHSHGGQVVLYCAIGLKLNRLITVSTPIRKDMSAVAREAATNIGSWWHVHSDWSDRMQVFGGLLDGQCGIERRFLLPGVINIGLPGIGHSEIVNKPSRFVLWEQHGLIAMLKGEVGL